MIKADKWISKHKKLILFIGLVLLVPSVFGYVSTRVNYDVLSYLPETLETVEGQDIMVDEFGMGAFSMVVVEDMELKDAAALKEKIQNVDHVEDVLWYDSVMDLSVPVEMLPEDLREALFKGNATMMIALFDNTTSSDEAMDAVTEMRSIVSKNCFISGMTGVVTDIKALALKEMPVFFGEISYITQALTAVLQLGVTMDYSIFLLNCYEDNKKRFPGDKDRAMAHAISNTFKSVVGSSVTTIAGFVALCFMTFALGRDMGIVMAKGVVIGVICCVTLLPSMILLCDKAIEKTKHKTLLPSFDKVSNFITKHHLIWIAVFLVLLYPAIHGNNNVEVYYNIDTSLPASLPSNQANKELEEVFNMNTVHMVLMEKGLDGKEKSEMLKEIEDVDGVQWALGLNSFVGPSFPESMIPKDVRSLLESDNYELQFICSEYRSATDEVNGQISAIQDIVKKYSPKGMVIGEAPLMKDLADVTDVDLKNVNVISIAAIFVIIMIVFKSISLPFILVAVIEFAIFVNMAVPYYQGITLPFVAGIVIGAIQLGATVDYAITSRYQRERHLGRGKKEAISIAHKTSMKSIIISGCSFFAATFGVGLYSQVDMISSICTLLSRGAVISTVVVLLVLPAMFMIFDPIICHTSIGFLPKKEKEKPAGRSNKK